VSRHDRKVISKRSDIRIAVAAEAGRALEMARTVGKRLRNQLNKNGVTIPDRDWLETAKWYEGTIAELGNLVVKDEIGAAVEPDPNQSELTAEEYAAELKQIMFEEVRKLSHRERRELLAETGLELPAATVIAGTTTGTDPDQCH
jgi:hypothetical protein